MCFNDRILFAKLKHWPYEEEKTGWSILSLAYRRLAACKSHAPDIQHVNPVFFWLECESWFRESFENWGITLYLVFYLAAIVAASSATYFKYKDTPGFASIGASGAVAAVLFAAILIDPMSQIMFIFLPIPIRAFIFGILYLWYSAYE